MIELMEKLGLRQRVGKEEHLIIYGGLREARVMTRCFHDPVHYAKQLKLRYRGGDSDLPQ